MTDVDLNRQAHVLAQAAKTAADLCHYLRDELPEHPDAMHPDTAESIHNAARELREGLDLATGAYRRVAETEQQHAPASQPQAAPTPAPSPQPQAATPAEMWQQQTGQGMSIPRPTWENQNQQAPEPQPQPQRPQTTETETPTAYAWR